MDEVVEFCAGLDVHRDTVVATVRFPQGRQRGSGCALSRDPRPARHLQSRRRDPPRHPDRLLAHRRRRSPGSHSEAVGMPQRDYLLRVRVDGRDR